MQLTDYTKDQLLALAPEFGVEVKPSMSKGAIVKEFTEDGVTAELILAASQTEDDEKDDVALDEVEETEEAPVVEEDDEDLVLVKMIRANNTYQIRGYTFKMSHPFALVKEKDADYLIEVDGGFRMASPKEAREFYS